jgi:alpha-mannosidase
MADKKRKFVVVSHTHWDREWYQPFEAFRARLVRMMDSLIDLFHKDPGFKHFVLDGQTVPLDDYLEIRPDRRPVIEKLVKEGRLRIGPNYMLPDEFLIGGEAWVRNLMFGVRSARQYGKLMNVGYSPDAFGHIAHLPAILRGFGIDSVLIWRGVGREVDVSEFRWRSPDGSEVLAVHFPYGYGYMAEVPEDQAAAERALKTMRETLEPFATTRNVLVPNGTDHLPAHTGLSKYIATANKVMDNAEMVHGTYEEFIDNVRGELKGKYNDLPVLEGEFRSSARSNVLAGVLSTRMWLKQRYAFCEDLLARYAEPLVAWSHLLTGPDAERVTSDKGLLHQAWKLLLQNGPHDSVTGCSVDPVYDDVGLRFEKCEQIADSLIREAHGAIGHMAAPPKQETVVVYNPEPGVRTDFCTVRLPIRDGELPTGLSEESGAVIPVQVLGRAGHSALDSRERVTLGFVANAVPPVGYKTYLVVYNTETTTAPRGGEASIENEYLRVSAEPDGTITLIDKASGGTYAGLNRFEDGGESGDEYTYNPPANDEIVRGPKGPAAIRITEVGPARWTLEVRQTYSLPARLTPDRQGRSDERADCTILSRVRLYPGVPRLDISTEVDNRSEDHRFRVLFPAELFSEMSFAEQHFGVVQRPTAPIEYDETWYETPANQHPQKTFVDVTNNERGFMIANRGLPEYEVIRDGDSVTVALTLLRCVSWLSREDLRTRNGHAGPMMHTPGAQVIGRCGFDYSVIPHEGDWMNAYREAHRFARPLKAIRVSGGTGEMPRQKSLLRLDGEGVTLSALKPAEDDNAVIVRVYNISDKPAAGIVALGEPVAHVEAVNLNEEDAGPVVVQGGAVRLDMAPNQIETYRFQPRGHA